jgi:hypothetical protein
MAKIDPRLEELLKKYGEDNKSVWDCHGTWVAYHAAVERMAAKANILFGEPKMIVNDYQAKTVVVCVSAVMGEKHEWSFGEVSPANNKNSYPYAMAEKRAKDRVALKLLGMAGLVYSEEEADDFKPAPKAEPNSVKSAHELKKKDEEGKDAWEKLVGELDNDLLDCHTLFGLEELRADYRERVVGWPKAWTSALREKFEIHENKLMRLRDAQEANDDFPGDIRNHVLLAGE